MLKNLKKRLYFVVARYFLFWAKIQMLRWRPKVIAVTGSSGKTTTMHALQAQLGEAAHYSYHANSAFGISFDILGLSRVTLLKSEWVKLFLLAPLRAFRKPYSEKMYVAEIDCDRPREGKMVAKLLKPAGVVWLSSTQTHSMNFESEVASGRFKDVSAAIAHSFGEVARAARDFIVINGDSTLMTAQTKGAKMAIHTVSIKDCTDYVLSAKGTVFTGKNHSYKIAQLLPKEAFYSLEASRVVAEEVGIPFDASFRQLVLPPGRSSLFEGIKHTTIIDSSYNSSADAFAAMVEVLKRFKAKEKWLVAGDILEQGKNESVIHKEMAKVIQKSDVKKVVLVGPRLKKSTYPELIKLKFPEKNIAVFEQPKDALEFLKEHLQGGETVLFKGARFLEGIIEHLLAHPEDVQKLCRRELIWQQRRKKWGL